MDGPVITQSVLLCLRELRERLTKAQQVAKAAEACAAAGSLSEAVTLALDIEHPLYEATRLSDATLLLGRLVKE